MSSSLVTQIAIWLSCISIWIFIFIYEKRLTMLKKYFYELLELHNQRVEYLTKSYLELLTALSKQASANESKITKDKAND